MTSIKKSIDTKGKISIDEEGQEKRVHPFSPADFPMISTDLVKYSIQGNTQPPSPQQQEGPNIVTSTLPPGCPDCIRMDSLNYENLELKEIIEKSEKFVTADKLLDNKRVTFDFDIPFEEPSKKMDEIFSMLGDKVNVRFKGIVDSTTGETRLLFYGSATS